MKPNNFLLLIAFLVIFTVGCASSPPRPKSGSLYTDFSNGDIRLDCRLSCAGKFGSNLSYMMQLHNAESWNELAKEVYLAGFNQDIAYYFLGRSAEGLENYQAAETYYLLGQAATACMLSGCGGLVFPDVINNRLAILKDKKINQRKPPSREAANLIDVVAGENKNIDSQNPAKPTELTASSNIACKTSADCPLGDTCRSKPGGGTSCAVGSVLSQETPVRNKQEVSESKTTDIQNTSVKKPEVSISEVADEVKLVFSGGVYEVPVTLNDVLKINVVLDSGAADVSIAPDVLLTLMRTGTIEKNDWLEGKIYQFADGSSAKSERFKLKSIVIGKKELKNVSCSLANSINAPMLLGQSALRQLGKYTIDYKKGVLQFD